MRDMVTLTDLLMREQRPVLQKYLEDTDSVGFLREGCRPGNGQHHLYAEQVHPAVAAHSRWRFFNPALDER